MGLFATIPVDEVTVQDIATAVEMTPAAVYYHFASKEQILLEGMQQFANQLLEEIRTQIPQPGDARARRDDHPRTVLDDSAAGLMRRCTS